MRGQQNVKLWISFYQIFKSWVSTSQYTKSALQWWID